MNDANVDNNPPGSNRPEMALVTAREALTEEFTRIEVPEDSEQLVSPSNSETASSFARVELKSYEDLQTLGFVPRGLAEERVRSAIAEDDEEAYQLATTMLHQPGRDCGCGSQGAPQERSRGRSPLRTAYNSIRNRHNRALARLLSDHYDAHVAWDWPLAGIVRKWNSYVSRNTEGRIIGIQVIIVILEDIIINRNATLVVDASAKSLLAHNIWIHDTGRLVMQGSYTKVWANSINRFNLFSAEAVEVAREHDPPWALNR